MLDPIIVTGAPRSRTSMAMQMLEICGLFLGDVIRKTRANPQGQCENHEIIGNVIKPELKAHGFDPKAQYPLPPKEWYSLDPKRRQKVLAIIKKQGLKPDMKWGFKATKAVFNWQGWNQAFPDAKWIIVRRNDTDIIKSCMSPKANFMDRYSTEEGWKSWLNAHKIKFEEIKLNLKYVYELDTDAVIQGNLSQLESIITALGLTWKPDKVRTQISP